MLTAALLVAAALVAPARGDGPPLPTDPPEQITIYTSAPPLAATLRCLHMIADDYPRRAICRVVYVQPADDVDAVEIHTLPDDRLPHGQP